MIDNQLYNYLLISQKWHTTDKRHIEPSRQQTSHTRLYANTIQWFGRTMVRVGQYLQRIAEPSYQTAQQHNL